MSVKFVFSPSCPSLFPSPHRDRVRALAARSVPAAVRRALCDLGPQLGAQELGDLQLCPATLGCVQIMLVVEAEHVGLRAREKDAIFRTLVTAEPTCQVVKLATWACDLLRPEKCHGALLLEGTRCHSGEPFCTATLLA